MSSASGNGELTLHFGRLTEPPGLGCVGGHRSSKGLKVGRGGIVTSFLSHVLAKQDSIERPTQHPKLADTSHYWKLPVNERCLSFTGLGINGLPSVKAPLSLCLKFSAACAMFREGEGYKESSSRALMRVHLLNPTRVRGPG